MPYGTVIAAEHLCASLSDTENTSMTLANLTGCTFTYSPAAGEVPKAGNRVKFVARMTPPDAMRRDYAVVDKVVEVEIFRTPPPITWKPKVTNLFDGEALTTQHLCAFLGSSRDQRLRTQAIYPGTLSYAPPVGTILGPPGRHPVVVTFTPAQPENALTTSITLNFDINKRAPKVAWIKDPVSGKMVCVKSTDDNRGSKHS